jgi:hydroxyacylglutathione hydrolase
MQIKCITSGKWRENCYLLFQNKDLIIVDPGECFESILNFINENSLNPLAIINTHAHFDHIASVSNLQIYFNIPFYLHSYDEKLLKSANFYMKFFGGISTINIPNVNFYLDNISELSIKNFLIKIIHTPGHTNGSVILNIENKLFTGDTLLKGKVGRIDLPGANKVKLTESLKIIINFPNNTLIYPGHGDISSINDELNNNKDLKIYLK